MKNQELRCGGHEDMQPNSGGLPWLENTKWLSKWKMTVQMTATWLGTTHIPVVPPLPQSRCILLSLLRTRQSRTISPLPLSRSQNSWTQTPYCQIPPSLSIGLNPQPPSGSSCGLKNTVKPSPCQSCQRSQPSLQEYGHDVTGEKCSCRGGCALALHAGQQETNMSIPQTASEPLRGSLLEREHLEQGSSALLMPHILEHLVCVRVWSRPR